MKNKIVITIGILIFTTGMYGQIYNYGLDVCAHDAKIEGKLNLQTSDKSVMIGLNAGIDQSPTTGFQSPNNFIGVNAGRSSVAGNAAELIGYGAGEFGDQVKNISMGYQAGQNDLNISDYGNVLIGHQAGLNADSSGTVVIGALAGQSASFANTYIGYSTGQNATGSDNVYFGVASGINSQSGSNNTYIGYESGKWARGDYNTFVGYLSGKGKFGSSGAHNVAIGMNAGEFAKGNKNVFIGNGAGRGNASVAPDSANVFIGYQAGANETGSNKLYIENSNSSTPLIWGDFLVDSLVINGDLNVTNTLTYTNCMMSSSDIRFKKNITPIKDALSKLSQVRGITHEWRHDEFPGKHWRQGKEYGVIAQELETVFPHAVVEDDEGYKMVDYTKLNPILIEAIKEQQVILGKNQEEITSMSKEVSSISDLDTRLKAIEAEFK